MRKGFSLLMVIAALFSTIFGCGGGGSSSTPTPTPTPGNTVSGVASKGLINAGLVTVYAITNNVKGATLATGTTGANGAYTLDIGSYTGPVLVEVSGGTYLDEATNSTKTGPNLHAVVNATTATTVAVTPLTELAWQNVGSTINVATINQANLAVGSQFGNIDIINTLPVDFKSPPATATQAQKNYAAYLAVISQLVKDSGRTLDTSGTSIYQNELKLTSGALSPVAITALNTVLQVVSPGATAITTPALPPKLVLTASKSIVTADGSDAVTFTASFQKSDGSAYGIADGTSVAFAVTSGTATISSVTTAKGDQATAVVKSSSSGDVTITATYIPTVTASATVKFLPVSGITLQTSKSTIIANGTDKASLTASFSPVLPDGVSVNFTIASGTAQFANGQQTATAVTNNNTASVDVLSSASGSVTVSAGYAAVTPATVGIKFIAQPATAIVAISVTKPIPLATGFKLSILSDQVGATIQKVGNENLLGFDLFTFDAVSTTAMNILAGSLNGINVPANTSILSFTYNIAAGIVPVFSVDPSSIDVKTFNGTVSLPFSLSVSEITLKVTYKDASGNVVSFP